MRKIKLISIITFFIILVFFISMLIGTKIPNKDKKQEQEVDLKIKEEVTNNEKPAAIKWDNISVEVEKDKEIITDYMKSYEENTYTLSINNIETFNKAKEMLGLKFTNTEDLKIDKDTFEKYDCAILLVFIENKNKLNVQNVLPYKEKIVIDFINDRNEFTIKERQVFCLLIPKLYNREKIEVTYSKDRMTKEEPKKTIIYKTFYIKNIEEFNKLNLKQNADKLYYTDFLDISKYREIADKVKIITQKELYEKELEGNDIALIFKKTNKKISCINFKEEGNLLNIKIKEIEEKYGNGITGIIVIVEKGKYSEYETYMK